MTSTAGRPGAGAGARDRNGLLDIAELAEAISQFFTSRDPGSHGNLAFGHL